MIMFAEVPSSLEIGGWLMCLFAVAGGVNQVMKLLDRTKESPTPLSTYQLKGDYVTHTELATVRKEVEKLAEETREDFYDIRNAMKHDAELNAAAALKRAENINHNIQDVMTAVGELRGRINGSLHDLTAQVSELRGGGISHRGH
jgi:hypothetical protein